MLFQKRMHDFVTIEKNTVKYNNERKIVNAYGEKTLIKIHDPLIHFKSDNKHGNFFDDDEAERKRKRS